MKLLLGIVIVYSVVNVAYSYYRYREKALSNGVLVNLIFSLLLYIDLLINRVIGYSSSVFVLGIVVCWLVSYLIVYVRKKLAK